jgi:hypothetical protein
MSSHRHRQWQGRNCCQIQGWAIERGMGHDDIGGSWRAAAHQRRREVEGRTQDGTGGWDEAALGVQPASSSPLSRPIYMPLPFSALVHLTTPPRFTYASPPQGSHRRRSEPERAIYPARFLAVEGRRSTAGERPRCRGRRTWTST